MADAIAVEAPSEEAAQALARAFARRFPSEIRFGERSWTVSVTPDRPAHRVVVELLDEVERWLVAANVDATRVHLDGRVYALVRPTPGERVPD